MNNIGRILFYVAAIALIIKLVVILYDQIGMLRILKDAGNFNRYWMTLYFNEYWLFIEPVLILVSISGFVIKKHRGFRLSLIFVYFVLTYGLLHYLTPIDKHSNFNLSLFTWTLLVTIMTNVPVTVRIFSREITQKLRLRANIIAFLIGLFLNGVLLIMTDNT